MVQINAEVTGLRELAKDSRTLRFAFAKSTLRTALRNAAKPVVKQSLENAKTWDLVRTGYLSTKGIAAKATVKKSGEGYANIGFTQEGAYGIPHEVGTSTLPAKPMLRPALESETKNRNILNAFILAMNKTIQKRLKKNRG